MFEQGSIAGERTRPNTHPPLHTTSLPMTVQAASAPVVFQGERWGGFILLLWGQYILPLPGHGLFQKRPFLIHPQLFSLFAVLTPFSCIKTHPIINIPYLIPSHEF